MRAAFKRKRGREDRRARARSRGRAVGNRELAEALDTDEAWIITHTGIRERRFVRNGEDCVTLAIDASRRALECAGLSGVLALGGLPRQGRRRRQRSRCGRSLG